LQLLESETPLRGARGNLQLQDLTTQESISRGVGLQIPSNQQHVLRVPSLLKLFLAQTACGLRLLYRRPPSANPSGAEAHAHPFSLEVT
jgi:hypothetical protein